MSNLKYTAGVVVAGVLAFGGVFAAQAATAPLLASSAAESGEAHEPDASSGAEAPGFAEDSLSEQLVGRWKAPEPANQDAFVEFNERGQWSASDGCNGASSTWEIDVSGLFSGGEAGPMTLIACDNVNIPQAVWSAVQVEVTSNHQLILTDEAGKEFLLVQATN